MTKKLTDYRNKNIAMRLNMALDVVYQKSYDPTITTVPSIKLMSEQFEVYPTTDLDEVINKLADQLDNRVKTFEKAGSRWTVSKILGLDTSVWCLDPMKASTYHPLPRWIVNKRAVRNVQNTSDNECFRWAVLSVLY